MVSGDGEFGGIYLWGSRAEAVAFYDEAWRRGIRERRGVDPELLVLDAPYLVRGRTAIEGKPIGARSIAYDATATLVLWRRADAGEATRDGTDVARRPAEGVKDAEGLVRAAGGA